MIEHILQQSCSVITTFTDVHGDQVEGSSLAVNCRFRYITELDKAANAEIVNTTDAIIWLSPDVNVQEGTIMFAESQYWRISRLVRARRMKGNTVEFLKCYVKKYEDLVPASPVLPNAPIIQSASNISQTSFTAHWEEVAGADNYTVLLSTLSGEQFEDDRIGAETTGTNSFTFTGLLANHTYYYRVSCAADDISSLYSQDQQVTTLA